MANAAKWVAVAKLLGQVLTFSSTLLLARVLEKSDFGLFALALLYTWLIDNVTDFGFQSALIQTKTLAHSALSSVLWLLLALSICLVGISWVSAGALAAFFGEPTLRELIQWMSLAFFCVPFSIVASSILSRRMELTRIARAELTAGVMRCACVLGFAYSGAGAMSLIYGYLIERYLLSVILISSAKWLPQIVFNYADVRVLFNFGVRVTGARLLWIVYTRLDVFIVGKLLGAQALGAYTIAAQIAFAFPQFISAAYYRLIFPLLSRTNDHAAFSRAFCELAGHLSFVCVPVMLLLSFSAEPLVQSLLGEKWTEVGPILQVLAMTGLFNVLTGLLPQASNAAGRPDLGVWSNLITIVIFGTAFYFAGTLHGMEGILACWLVLAPIRFLLTVYGACAVIDIEPIAYWRAQQGAWLGGFGIAISVGFSFVSMRHHPALTEMVVFAIVAGAIYIVLARQANISQFDKFIDLIRRSTSRMTHEH